MSEITRWSKYGETYPGDDGEMFKHPDGEWVRWEDVKDLIPIDPHATISKDIQRGIAAVASLITMISPQREPK